MNRWKLNREDALVLCIDYQDKLAKSVYNREEIEKHNQNIIKTANIYKVPILFTTQYKKGLGDVSPALFDLVDKKESLDKTAFSIMEEETIVKALEAAGKKQIIVTGIESHICVLSSVRDLIDAGYQVFVPRNCISSREESCHINGLDQMREYGAVISNSESILFEIAKVSGTPEFKQMQALIK